MTCMSKTATNPVFGEVGRCRWGQKKIPLNLCTDVAARGSKEVKTFDVNTMHKHGHREEDRMPDDARGSVQIWRVEDYELVDWPKDRYGIFFQGDSYVVLYTYGRKDNERYIIYFWLVS